MVKGVNEGILGLILGKKQNQELDIYILWNVFFLGFYIKYVKAKLN